MSDPVRRPSLRGTRLSSPTLARQRGPRGRLDSTAIVGIMRELTDSSPLRADPGQLQRRLASDGYLFLPGLLPAADVRAAHDAVLSALSAGGWTDPRGHPAGPQRAVTVRQALADPCFRTALASRGLNRLPYLAPLRQLVRSLLGPGAFCYPAKVLRAVYPEQRGSDVALGRYIHQD